MVHISNESPSETDARLRRVIAGTHVQFYDEPYAFVEFPSSAFPAAVDPRALALIRDEGLWSQLIPSLDPQAERFMVFRCHFPAGMDNSGFVGWLASRLKTRLGTGVIVICGQNQADGGIFDYWGVPLSLADAAGRELRSLLRGEAD